ncbi:centrosomal protein of 97 kDa isoform X3 [Tachysurus fulvidraco]|uniref:centrosomal protein of 97 kDa isoform X3 n=1 Tax=Tachysurus fulvidraco TaxID=1234273 RepID=UPI001FED413C|nr:centrosomal protein of 97 kDa isoform X3 [Tachysurus fulvidraco]
MAATEEASFYHPVTQMAKPEGPGLVDLSSQGIHKLDPNFCSLDTRTLILDQNHIIKLEHLEKNVAIQQLSVACNRLVRMMGVSKLTNLRVLNLPNNSIGYIEGMKDLVHLEWLNLAGNNIKVIEQLNSCIALQHLDLSDNNISHTGDISKLSALKTLLLNGNIITSLRSSPVHFPLNLCVLSLAENEIQDLAEVSYLAPLHNLQQLSIMNNPCVMATSSMPGCDHRPYVVSWCLNLKVLDGYVVSQKEGQHQKQLLQEGQDNSSSPLPPTQLDMDQHWNDPAHKSLNVIGQPEASEPVVQMNTWMSNTSSEHVLGAVPAHSRDGDSLVLEDMQTDEEKLHGSLLSSESAFLPVNSVVRSPSPADSEEEELDEPDSLAPPNPARSHPRKVERVTSFHTVEKGEHLEADRMVHLQGSKATNAPEAGTELRGPSAMVAECHPHSAAVKIQAWWRGHWTRQQHPQAKEVRCEIRLRRLQDHIVYLTAELERVQQQQQEEKLQRMIQEEAVKFLWKQLQAMMEWQCSVKEQLSCLSPMQNITAGPIPASPKTTALPMPSEVSIPESGFQSPGDQQGVLEDSMSSAATGGSPETVRTLQPTSSPGSGADGDSQDSSLLEQYLSSVQRQEEEDEARENCSSLFSPAHGSEVSSCPDVVG